MNGITPIDFENPEAQSPRVIVSPESLKTVQDLTKASRNMFECLKVFHENYSTAKKERLTSGNIEDVHDHIMKQSKVYATTIDASLIVAEKGIIIARNARLLLDDEYVSPIMVASTTRDAQEAHRQAVIVEESFGSIRRALFSDDSLFLKEISVQDLRSMGPGRLVEIASFAVVQLVIVIGNFVDWWLCLRLHVTRLISLTRFYCNGFQCNLTRTADNLTMLWGAPRRFSLPHCAACC